MDLLHISSLRRGADGNPQSPNAANADEAKANPYPTLPDPLVLKNGRKVASARTWWNQRRPEIVEDFDREVYGRVPRHVPKVRWEVTETTRESTAAWLERRRLAAGGFLFPSRIGQCDHLGTRQYARLVSGWVAAIGLPQEEYGTHSLRRTKASLIYRRTKNLRAVQLLLGHAKLESTVRHLGIDVDDALELAEQTDL